MKNITVLAAGIAFFTMMPAGHAADHLFTATAAGGLTLDSQPFLNGTPGNNPGRFNDDVPGQGSPLSGGDNTTPASDTPTGVTLTVNPAASTGKTAPSVNSAVVP
jgi:hypothetical protein